MEKMRRVAVVVDCAKHLIIASPNLYVKYSLYLVDYSYRNTNKRVIYKHAEAPATVSIKEARLILAKHTSQKEEEEIQGKSTGV
jgi:hypothetical protein